MVGGTVTLNKMLINSFVVFFCLHRPFVASYFTKLLLAERKGKLPPPEIFRPRCNLHIQFSELYS